MQSTIKSRKKAAKNYVLLKRGDIKRLASENGVSEVYANQVLSRRRRVGKDWTKSYKIHQAALSLSKSRLEALKQQLEEHHEHLAQQ
jgi:hypothetical protein